MWCDAENMRNIGSYWRARVLAHQRIVADDTRASSWSSGSLQGQHAAKWNVRRKEQPYSTSCPHRESAAWCRMTSFLEFGKWSLQAACRLFRLHEFTQIACRIRSCMVFILSRHSTFNPETTSHKHPHPLGATRRGGKGTIETVKGL